MSAPSSQNLDFKPFFDMAIGILFILLILISAQLFFSQWGSQPTPEQLAQRAREARHQQIVADQARLLDDLAARLGAAGFAATVDKAGKSVAVDLAGMAAAGGSASSATLDATRVADLAKVVLDNVACVAVATAPTTATEACPEPYAARLSLAEARVEVSGPVAGATPAPAQRLLALQFAAQFFTAKPDSLSLAAPSGALAVRPDVPVEVVSSTPQGGWDTGLVRFRLNLVDPEAAR